MASVASQLIEQVTAHAQNDSLEYAREICAGGTYFPNNLRICVCVERHSWNETFSVFLSNAEYKRLYRSITTAIELIMGQRK